MSCVLVYLVGFVWSASPDVDGVLLGILRSEQTALFCISCLQGFLRCGTIKRRRCISIFHFSASIDGEGGIAKR